MYITYHKVSCCDDVLFQDLYIICGVVFLCLMAVQNAIAGFFANRDNQETAKLVDKWSIITMVILTVLFHLIYIIVLAYRVSKPKYFTNTAVSSR